MFIQIKIVYIKILNNDGKRGQIAYLVKKQSETLHYPIYKYIPKRSMKITLLVFSIN